MASARYIDNLAEGVSIDRGDYLVHWTENGAYKVLRVPDLEIVRKSVDRFFFIDEVFPHRQAGLEALTPYIFQSQGVFQLFFSFYGSPSTVIAPTMYSEASTPRIYAGIHRKDEDMRQAAREAEEAMVEVLKGMVAGRILTGLYKAVHNPRTYDRISNLFKRRTAEGTLETPATGATSSSAKGITTPEPSLAGYPTAAGEILGEVPPGRVTAPGGTTLYGRAMEAELPAILKERFPQTKFEYRFGSGTPDVEWVGGKDPGFDIAELKPATYKKYLEFRGQVVRWGANGWSGRKAGQTFRAAKLSYRQDGTIYVEDVGIVGWQVGH